MRIGNSGEETACPRFLLYAVLTAAVCCAGPGEAAESDRNLRDVEYGRADGQTLCCDILVSERDGLKPGVILIHGGGWCAGDKQDMRFLADTLSGAGFVCFSINYRLADEHPWPACLDDVLIAIRWVKAHAGEYETDPKRIALLGYSAGGHLACMAAVRAGPAERVEAVAALAAPTNHEADSERRGGLSPSLQKLLRRPADIESARPLLREISPVCFIHSDLPRFLLVHGTEDKSVEYSQSVSMQTKLHENDVPCELITLKGAAHKIDEWEHFEPEYLRTLSDWLGKELAVDRLPQ